MTALARSAVSYPSIAYLFRTKISWGRWRWGVSSVLAGRDSTVSGARVRSAASDAEA
jgi:hypothetical protein